MRSMIFALTLLLLISPCIADASDIARKPPTIIGGIGLTHLTVYTQRPAPDGVNSGSPHVHAVTDEAYYILSGTGEAELHDPKLRFVSVPLEQNMLLQFPPGVLHRIVSTNKLVILAIMGSGGLAERGDARIYFGKSVDDDPKEYARLMALPKEKGLEGALDRRDDAVKAYQGLLKLWETDKDAYFKELARFNGVHLKNASALKSVFNPQVDSMNEWGMLAKKRTEALPNVFTPSEGALYVNNGKESLGMCGILQPVTDLKWLSEIAR
jgi:mannose-6-phosphate isomerase-like protein (cupin superfamily)